MIVCYTQVSLIVDRFGIRIFSPIIVDNQGLRNRGVQRPMTKSDLIFTNIAISVNKSVLLVNKSALSV